MTNEEAIAIIKPITESSRNVDSIGLFQPKPITVALEMAIEALEKQIPKKPMTQINDNERWLCPNCKTMIWMMLRFKWCPYCGRAIDWSEE